MDRITDKQLRSLIDVINEVTGSPKESWVREGDKFTAQIGNYHLSGQYGGVSLERMMNEGGGVNVIFGTTTKRDLYNQLHAFLRGLEARKAA